MTNTEQLDLDAIEARAAWAGYAGAMDVKAVLSRFQIAREDVPALLARVRTAEAERDETAEEWEYAAEANGILVPMGEDQRIFRGETLRRRRPAGPWEPVPPTRETEEQP
jgi:hypothetical protein